MGIASDCEYWLASKKASRGRGSIGHRVTEKTKQIPGFARNDKLGGTSVRWPPLGMTDAGRVLAPAVGYFST